MTRNIWILALLGALACFLGAAVLCVVALLAHRPIGFAGWTIVVSCALLFWIALGYVRFRMREAVLARKEKRAASTAPDPSLNYLSDVPHPSAQQPPTL